ncbi:OB-fold putative lipoprotein [Niabella beijingensis]|uniref:OB-fold putative lipoprotein n=1 Tax=Niabella beijingensis TaxID=2872700 RepID=UPI001CBBA56F|nr:OB-fold putative lipoprotein [Niabella beijingensis]MBZ4189015.1 OB-fold putative lipoprotein [Niabella beijingensis]
MKKGKLVLLLLLIIIVLGAGYAYYQYNRKPADIKTAEAEIRTGAGELIAAFNNDEATANKKYVEKIIAVTGKITDIQIDTAGQATVFLDSGDPLASVTCSFYDTEAAAVKDLSAGRQVTIKGVCTGKLMDVVLNKCSIVQ